MEVFGKEYYETLNYSNYTQRENKYWKLAKELDQLFGNLGLDSPTPKILDYGCAFGYLITAFQRLGYYNIWGYDISVYAKQEAISRGCRIVDTLPDSCDILLVLDVLEHMEDHQIDELFDTINSEILIGRIPVAMDGEDTFHLEVSRIDKTHINCKTKVEWEAKFRTYGYHRFFYLNLYSIYDSDGVMAFMAFR